ncbi:bifunctional phosphoribosylaminoimidazolecarboxamide formyltransferase/IMP cyclohydrolase, partial [Candidatus Aminicenantes bacterium AC-335-B20]|nr:bifunctional phosphoribosylaminoimidazolecarboxamide formyltransferase/IMP cyclohydrolase [Candidatus Aminicenantes bacterium AC-335-B20]
RVKTLHPFLFSAILARRNREKDLEEIEKFNIKPIDMVVVNLYPFKEATSREELKLDDALEFIDIGGVSLIRASAKNFKDVIVVVDPNDYSEITRLLKEEKDISFNKRIEFAKKAFQITSEYDSYIFNYLNSLTEKKEFFTPVINLSLLKIQELRYGENPHQKGALYSEPDSPFFQNMIKYQGKELSFNNLLDINSAYELCMEFKEPFCCIIKHNSPCGAALGKNALESFEKALQTDPLSAFGGIIGFNCAVDEQVASEIVKSFYEVVIAPEFSEKALEIFQIKKNLRVVKFPFGILNEMDFKRITGGWLVQEKDSIDYVKEKLRVVTKKRPSEKELKDLLFAWKVVKYVKSNAIVFAKDLQTVGIGAGQMSRVDAAKVAISKARLPLKNSVVASDAFFPFPDALEECIKAGASAFIQPGGSIRDEEVIKTADNYGVSMIFTGIRHFRH